MLDPCILQKLESTLEAKAQSPWHADSTYTSAWGLPSEAKWLSERVQDWDDWDQKIISFGKLQNRQMSHYTEALSSTEQEVQRYVGWSKGQVDNADGCLKDLGFFLLAMEQGSREELPIIPGSDVIRQFKSS